MQGAGRAMLLLAVCLALGTGLLSAAMPARALTLTPEACPGDAPRTSPAGSVACGDLKVPESETGTGGRMLSLKVAVITPAGATEGPPLLLLHGGPGGGVVEAWPGFLGAARPFGDRRIVMFDQRGAGLSTPPLCPSLSEALVTVSAQGLSAADHATALVEATAACSETMARDGADTGGYGTQVTVRDIERLRDALGIDLWDIYGISYGTTVGLAYLDAHPDRIRAAVFDSVYLPQRPGFSSVLRDFRESFLALREACSSDPVCVARFGDLEALLIRVAERLAGDPLLIPSDEPAAREGVFRVSAPTFLSIVHQLLYDRAAYPVLPLLLSRAAEGDGQAFLAMVGPLAARARAVRQDGYFAVECAERFPHDSEAAYRATLDLWPQIGAQMTLIATSFAQCAVWGAPPRPLPPMPLDVSVPVLVLAGTWDPITRPQDSREAARLLGPRATYVEVPYAGHGARRSSPCAGGITRAFLSDPGAPPDTSCLADARPPEFVTGMVRAPRLGLLAQQVEGGDMQVVALAVAPLALLLLAIAFPLGAGYAAVRGRLPAGALGRAPAWLTLAALALLVAVAGSIWSAAQGLAITPMTLAFGLPAGAWIWAVPAWVGAGLALVALLRLGAGAPSSSAGRILFALVATGVAATLAGLWWLGLLVPQMI